MQTEAVAPTVDFLAQLAGEGPALEFAIGAGRIAVPLSGLFSHRYQLQNGKVIKAGGTRHRYVWPSETDVMVKMAGLDLVKRSARWDRAEFTGDSKGHRTTLGG